MAERLVLKTVKMENVYNKDTLKKRLLRLAEDDVDFNGENGLEYVSEEAKAKGYKSEAEYSADFFIKEFLSDDRYDHYEFDKRIEKTIENYIDDWMRSVKSYYTQYDYSINFVGDSGCVISLAYVYSN